MVKWNSSLSLNPFSIHAHSPSLLPPAVLLIFFVTSYQCTSQMIICSEQCRKRMRLFVAGDDHLQGPARHLLASSRYLKVGVPVPLHTCTPFVVTQLTGSATELWGAMPARPYVAFLVGFLLESAQPRIPPILGGHLCSSFLHFWAS